jgi:penicillin-binding protein 2
MEFGNQSNSDFRQRASFAALAISIGLGALAMRFGQLQVWQHEDHAARAEENRVALLPIQPPRGRIFDRYGETLARNDAGFSLEIEPFQAKNLNQTLEEIGKVIELKPAEINRFRRAAAEARRFDSVPLKTKLTDAEVARLVTRVTEIPGVNIQQRTIRSYPFADSSSHLLGHIGRISRADRDKLTDSNLLEEYFGISHIGKLGIEKSYETALKGVPGFQKIEVTASGRLVRELDLKPPIPGKNLQLSIDYGLQKMVEEAYAGRRGALVAMSTNTGELFAMVSMPNFNPNAFVDGIDPDLWNQLSQSPDVPLLNRALRGIYPPGSTYKPFMAIAGLASGARTPDEAIQDPGYFMLGNHRFRDYNPKGNGRVDLKKSIVVSSDTYYYKLAHDMGVDTIHEFISPFGFGRTTGIDIEGETAGILPSSEWKLKRFGKEWLTGETPSIGIGQGYNAFTVLQLVRATAALANGGKLLRPRLVKSIENSQTGELVELPAIVERQLKVEQEWLDIVHDALVEVNQSGTGARVMAGVPYSVAGKTGTAQVFSVKQDEVYEEDKVPERLRDHSLYIAYAPADKPQVAVAVVVENGGFGAAAAAPLARKVFDYLLVTRKKEGYELP